MTTAAPSTALATIQPAFTDPERLALAGFLAGYRGLIGEAYALDLRQFTTWCRARRAGTCAPRRCSPAGGRSAAAGWPSQTRSSGPSAPAKDCPPHPRRSWSGPGTPTKPNGTGAVKPASELRTPATRSGPASPPLQHRRGVEETGRCSCADGSVVTGTPLRDKIPVRVVKEEEPLQHRLIRRPSRVPAICPICREPAHPSGIWSARSINVGHIHPASAGFPAVGPHGP